jgi:hypothetical protein
MFGHHKTIIELRCAVCKRLGKATIFRVDMTDEREHLGTFTWARMPKDWWLSEPLDPENPHVRCPACLDSDRGTVTELSYEPVSGDLKCTCKHKARQHAWGKSCALCQCTRLTLNLPLGEIYTDESLRKVRTGGLNEVLRASIAEMGQQVAVLVTPIGSKLRRELKIPKTKRYYLVTGFGRYDTLTDLGKKTIRANVEVLSHLDAIDRYLKSNMHEETYVDQ